MAFKSPQPTVYCVITFFLLSSLNNQYASFLDFFVIYIIILVFPIHGICGNGMLGEFGNWLGHLGEGRGPRRLSNGEQYAHVFRPRRLCRVSTSCLIAYPATLSTCGGGRSGTDNQLGRVRGPRRLRNGEYSAHVCGPIGAHPAFEQYF